MMKFNSNIKVSYKIFSTIKSQQKDMFLILTTNPQVIINHKKKFHFQKLETN